MGFSLNAAIKALGGYVTSCAWRALSIITILVFHLISNSFSYALHSSHQQADPVNNIYTLERYYIDHARFDLRFRSLRFPVRWRAWPQGLCFADLGWRYRYSMDRSCGICGSDVSSADFLDFPVAPFEFTLSFELVLTRPFKRGALWRWNLSRATAGLLGTGQSLLPSSGI